MGELGDVIEKGLRVELKAMIKAKLVASVDQLLEDMAIEIANNIVVRAESMKNHADASFGPMTQVVVQFNLKDPPMVYDTVSREVKRRDVLKR